MKYLLFLIFTFMISPNVFAHGGTDPLQELDRNAHALQKLYSEYKQLQNADERLDNLRRRISLLQHNVMTLRNLLAGEYPHVKAKMSKYKVDYMQAVDDSLDALKLMARQFKQAMP